eukprot:6483025-Amphidinium_carterae.2
MHRNFLEGLQRQAVKALALVKSEGEQRLRYATASLINAQSGKTAGIGSSLAGQSPQNCWVTPRSKPNVEVLGMSAGPKSVGVAHDGDGPQIIGWAVSRLRNKSNPSVGPRSGNMTFVRLVEKRAQRL